jgi:hypothetical protein
VLTVAVIVPSTVRATAVTTTTTTTTEYAPHVMFNEGQLDPGMHCSTAEWNLLTDALMALNNNDDDDDATNDDHDRHLQATFSVAPPKSFSTLPHSSTTAAAPAPHTIQDNDTHRRRSLYRRCGCSLCIFAGMGCAGQASRRQRQRNLMRRSHQRQTLNDSCPLDEVSTVLDTVSTLVSPACAALVLSPRTLTCRPVVDCAISQVNVWDAISNTMVHDDYPLTNGPTLCSNQKITFEAGAHFDLGSVQFTLRKGNSTSTKTTSEYVAPYFMHGNAGSNVYGTYFAPGNYTLVIAPDGNDATETKLVQFTVAYCPSL